MSNPLFNVLGGGMPQGNGPMQMIQQFIQFKQNFSQNMYHNFFEVLWYNVFMRKIRKWL